MKRFQSTVLLFAGLGVLLLGTACDRPEAPGRGVSDPRIVAVSNYPLAYFVERIGGDRITVEWRIPPGIDPASWSPNGDDLAAIQRADLIFLNGATFEKWLPTASLPVSRVVDTTAGLKDRLLPAGDGSVHAHGPEGSHSHAGTAATTWLDPEIAMAQATTIHDALVRILPAHQEEFGSNLGLLMRQLQERGAPFEQAVNAAPTTPVFFNRPVFQYLSERYRMNGADLHWKADTIPTAEQLEELDALRAEHPADWFIWDSPPTPEAIAALQDRGIQSIVFETCGNRPESGDLLDTFDSNAVELRRVYGVEDG
ncbi:MAG: metal ABC transporter substrate-binding protein [Phycisphaerales bacterium]|jgi:zinc transport system substrate-binding protein|nr:metal ABC transporter substrate-binding protein [Phycisphaerales bacterium]